MINDDIAYSKAVHKYLFKAFYKKTNHKKYDLQIWQYNIDHTNIITMKDVIILEKAKRKKGY